MGFFSSVVASIVAAERAVQAETKAILPVAKAPAQAPQAEPESAHLMENENQSTSKSNNKGIRMNQSFDFSQYPMLAKIKQKHIADMKARANRELAQHRFLVIKARNNLELVFQVAKKQLWYADPNKTWNGIKKDYQIAKLKGWYEPTWQELVLFANNRANNPWASGSNNRLFGEYGWKVEGGYYDLDRSDSAGYYQDPISYRAVAICDTFNHIDGFFALLCWADENGYAVQSKNREAIDLSWFSDPFDLESLLSDIDYNRCRLPELDSNRFSDVHQGMWELTGLPAEYLLQQGVRARDPALDVKSGCIGIDFGTSSTVVAYEDENGRARLLRIGVEDFYTPATAAHYENPTVLEFVDFEQFFKAWSESAYQPLVNWDDVRCSHQALHKLRDNDGNVQVVGSMLPKIKQWALREADDVRLRIRDQAEGRELELAPLTLRNPVKGAKLTVSENDPFDPIELYAWFLGLNINWRNRGIFLTYYLTFPVAYPKDVKEKILASFRRGLLRSLPEALVSNSEIMEKFSVEERASEPAAYVAAAMPAHHIQPTDEGVAYAVFDFGGGTTDFDFGFYRWANEEEENNEGIETVFEHFEAAGDRFLGGENLLENLAYRVFLHNLDICRDTGISFTRPLDADDFSGSELLVAKTQSAYTNTLMLMAKLRPFWESGVREENSIFWLDLIDRNDQSVSVDLSVPYDKLQEYLESRIHQGIKDFFVSMKKAFAKQLPRKVDILLAGNSSRSRIVTDSFGLLPDENVEDVAQARCDIVQGIINDVFGDICPEFISHAPLLADADNNNNETIPTAKTGVALGILKLQKGSGVKVINHASAATDEAPFAYYVGNARRGKFNIGLVRNEAYHVWKKIGMPSENVFHLYYTQSNLAFNGDMEIGHNELFKKTIQFAGDNAGKAVFARAIKPNAIELCLAVSDTELEVGNSDNIQEIIFS